jgi:hypothetical protein
MSRRLNYIILSWVLLICFHAIRAQESDTVSKKLDISGYFSDMQSITVIDSTEGQWIIDNQLTNRFNFFYYPVPSLALSFQSRNRFIFGDLIKMDPLGTYKEGLSKDGGFLDLSFNVLEGNSYLLNINIDRLWVRYTLSKFEVTLGRQRINWGQTYVWNPNDIFNTYSYFDFDYEEKPGSDAIRLQYYLSAVSVLEGAVKVDSSRKVTAAVLYRMNHFGYDIQFLGGLLNSDDLLAGLGWSGSIGGAGFKGEMSYFHPRRNIPDTTGIFLFTLGIDYTFNNSLYIGFEGLYNQLPEDYVSNGFVQFYKAPLTVKNLSFTRYNLFAQIRFPVTPIFGLSLAGMYFPDDHGYFVGPSLTYSLMDNFDISLFLQFFKGEFPNYAGIAVQQVYNLGFLRLKYNF